MEKNSILSIMDWIVAKEVPVPYTEINPGLWLVHEAVDRTYYTEIVYVIHMDYNPDPSDTDVDTYYELRDLLDKKMKAQKYI